RRSGGFRGAARLHRLRLLRHPGGRDRGLGQPGGGVNPGGWLPDSLPGRRHGTARQHHQLPPRWVHAVQQRHHPTRRQRNRHPRRQVAGGRRRGSPSRDRRRRLLQVTSGLPGGDAPAGHTGLRTAASDMNFRLPHSVPGGKHMDMCRLGSVGRLASIGVVVFALTSGGAWADQPGRKLPGVTGIRESTAAIAERQAASPPKAPHPDHELEYPDRSALPQNPAAPAVASLPAAPEKASAVDLKIHTTSLSFDGATLTDTGAFPPDSMGTAGPTQFITFVNGRIRSFTKAGVADGVINADPDVFFASVTTPVAGAVVLDFTSDPQIRYDRFTARWYMSIIDVPCTNATCTTTAPNRWMVAVSDAASNGTISGSTVWTFFQFQASPGTDFCDYPSLGVDVNALYIGCNMFSSAGSFVGTNGYVVRKVSALAAGPLTVTMFANLAAGAGTGPESPRGVDNFDPGATEGYFVGPDNATFSTIMFRRVSNPGSLTPTISANISVAVPTTTLSGTQTIRLVQHAGNTGGNNGLLDTLD